ncbi:MAG: TIR domain-containing protein [Acidimicrobiales bacterium]
MRVFLSYARADADSVRDVRKSLEVAGHEVWVDADAIPGGDRWRSAVVKGIDRCETFLVVLSQASAVSEHVPIELDLASDAGKRIIPLMIEHVEIPDRLRYSLTGLQRIDASADRRQGLDDLLTALDPDAVRSTNGSDATGSAKTKGRPVALWAGFGLAAAAAIVVLALALTGDGTDSPGSEPSSTQVASPTTSETASMADNQSSLGSDETPGSADDTTAVGPDCERAQSGDTDLRQANLQNCVLDEARLVGLDLSFSDFRGSSLRGADLSGSVLARTRLDNADLTGATVTGSHLYRAELVSAEGLDEIDWAGTLLERSTCDDSQPCFFDGAVVINSDGISCSANDFAAGAPIAAAALSQPIAWQDRDEDCLHDEFERSNGILLNNPDTDDDGLVDGIDGHGGDETPLSLYEQFRLMR